MLDKFMDRLMESATLAYMPPLGEIARVRKAELEEMEANVRANPDQVGEWFDREIEKLGNMSAKEIMKNATAGI